MPVGWPRLPFALQRGLIVLFIWLQLCSSPRGYNSCAISSCSSVVDDQSALAVVICTTANL